MKRVVLSVNLFHLLDPYSARALLPNEERIEWIKQDRWIHYSRAERVLERLTALLHYPPRDRMPCVLLFGATGMGKTSLVQKFLRDYRSSFDAVLGRTRLPVVSIQMPPAPNEREFYEEILVSMGGVLVAGISITTLRHRTRIYPAAASGS